MIKVLHNIVQLRRIEKILLIKAFLLLGVIRLSLFFHPLKFLRNHLEKRHFTKEYSKKSQLSPERIAWAVTIASGYIPKATCLSQALTTKLLLAEYGHQSKLVIGVTKENISKFEAHAWVECGGKVIIGGPKIDRYTRLRNLKGE